MKIDIELAVIDSKKNPAPFRKTKSRTFYKMTIIKTKLL